MEGHTRPPYSLSTLPKGVGMGTAAEPSSIRLFIIERLKLVRLGVRSILRGSGRIDIIGEAATADQGVKEVVRLAPDVVLLEMSSEIGWLNTLRAIKSASPATRVILFASEDVNILAGPLLKLADGYVSKREEGADLRAAIETAAAKNAAPVTGRLWSLLVWASDRSGRKNPTSCRVKKAG